MLNAIASLIFLVFIYGGYKISADFFHNPIMGFFGALGGIFAALPVLAIIGYFLDLKEEEERKNLELLKQAELAREEAEHKAKTDARLAKEREEAQIQATKREKEIRSKFPHHLQSLILKKSLPIDIAQILLSKNYSIVDCQEICHLISKGLLHEIAETCLENSLDINKINVACLQKWSVDNVHNYVNKVFSWDDCVKINRKDLEVGMGMGIVKAMYGTPDQIEEKVLKTKIKHIWKYIEIKNSPCPPRSLQLDKPDSL